MKFRLQVYYDYDKELPEGVDKYTVATQDLMNIAAGEMDVALFMEVMGGRLTFAIEPLE